MEPSHARRRVLRLGLAALAAPALVRAAPFAREAAPWATASAAPARAAETEEVPIGAIYPLSGPLAVLGDEGLRGLELAVEERNAAGGVLGRRLRLLKADATDPASAAGEAKRLIGERAVALFGTHSGPLSLAAAQAAELAGTPYFELCAGADSLTERGLRALFRACPANGALGSASVDAVADVLAPLWGRPASGMRVALLHRDGAGDGAGIADTQLARLQVRGMVLADRVPYMRDTADLQPIVQRLRAAEVEVVLHAGATGDATLLFGQMRQAGWRPRMVVGAGSAYALADAAAVGPDLDGAMAVSLAAYAVREDACPGVGAAAAAYEKRYGMKPRSGHPWRVWWGHGCSWTRCTARVGLRWTGCGRRCWPRTCPWAARRRAGARGSTSAGRTDGRARCCCNGKAGRRSRSGRRRWRWRRRGRDWARRPARRGRAVPTGREAA